jgi:RNA polymerase sigma factor (TIGR02999 family)
MAPITELLQRVGAGERGALDALFQRLYPELRRLARARLSRQGRPGDMQTTSLVHEVYLRLLDARELSLADRGHFIAYSANVMRSVIVDSVRAAQRQRRGGDVEHVPVDTAVADVLAQPEDVVLDVDRALADLARLEPRLVRVVEMRWFAGLKETEIAQALGVTDRTVRRDWEKARLLLAHALKA